MDQAAEERPGRRLDDAEVPLGAVAEGPQRRLVGLALVELALGGEDLRLELVRYVGHGLGAGRGRQAAAPACSSSRSFFSS